MTKAYPTDKRVPKQNIVQGSPALLSKEDLVFTKDGIASDSLQFESRGYLSAGFGSESIYGLITVPKTSPVESAPQIPVFIPDVPGLADIESITYEEYPDPLTGIAKYKAILKIRNSSTEKNNVSGVDARIYTVSGSTSYVFQNGTASSGVNTPVPPSFVQSVTWYNASGKYNPFSGSIVSSASIVGTDSYPSDGTGVPADSSSGTSTVRTRIAWRKTEQEALNAVNQYMEKMI